jgi:aspartyl-tRNA synthetase
MVGWQAFLYVPELLFFVEFVEIETPLLFRKTCEGAKEFQVPFKDESGQSLSYSLPQSPQQVIRFGLCLLSI